MRENYVSDKLDPRFPELQAQVNQQRESWWSRNARPLIWWPIIIYVVAFHAYFIWWAFKAIWQMLK